MPKKRTFPVFAYVFGLLMIALGAVSFVLLPIGCKSVVAQYSANEWPSVQGTVVAARLLERETENEESTYTEYHAQVSTRYEIDGRNYEIREVYVGQRGAWASNYARERKLVRKYRKGRRVSVYYNPADPGVATLEPGLRPWNYASIVMDSVFVLIGLASLIYAIKETFHYIAQFFRRRTTTT